MNDYCALASHDRQRGYIMQMIDSVKPVRSKGIKGVSNQFHLMVGGKRVRVGRNFMEKTLVIGKKTIHYTLQKRRQGDSSQHDPRGKQQSSTNTNKT